MANAFVVIFLLIVFILAISRLDELTRYLTSTYKTTDESWAIIDLKRY